jgi:hypothetical protein
MTDDIVTRLLDFTPLKDADLARLLLDAADEISDLRTKLAQKHTDTPQPTGKPDVMHSDLWQACTCDPSSGFVCIYHE